MKKKGLKQTRQAGRSGNRGGRLLAPGLDDLIETLEILFKALLDKDNEKAMEAVTVSYAYSYTVRRCFVNGNVYRFAG